MPKEAIGTVFFHKILSGWFNTYRIVARSTFQCYSLNYKKVLTSVSDLWRLARIRIRWTASQYYGSWFVKWILLFSKINQETKNYGSEHGSPETFGSYGSGSVRPVLACFHSRTLLTRTLICCVCKCFSGKEEAGLGSLRHLPSLELLHGDERFHA